MALLNRNNLGAFNLERSARLVMGGVAVTAAIFGVMLESGVVSRAPTYERQSWYLVTSHTGFTVTSELEDESACRKREEPGSVCRSGSSMVDEGMPGIR